MSANSNVTSGFIDLATADEIEKYLYGGPDAFAYFVRETRKSTWFTQVPCLLSKANGTAEFGGEYSVQVSRAGDYLLHAWLRVNIPAVTASAAYSNTFPYVLRWTRNLMHNLISECSITFNDMVAARFESHHLDFWAAFTTPAGKQNGYKNMIGDVDDLMNPILPASGAQVLPAATLNLPLPLFFARDSGVALPTAALPYNDIYITFTFRNWADLLIADSVVSGNSVPLVPVVNTHITATPALGTTQVWGNYAIVSNDERKRMGCAPRYMLIEQVQWVSQSVSPATNSAPTVDIRFSQPVKSLFWGVENTTYANQKSNYTAGSFTVANSRVDFSNTYNTDPLSTTSLVYENTQRLNAMGSDYFSLVQPWFHANAIPIETGYHMYSYSLDFLSVDPKGSTNYGKLTNVSLQLQLSDHSVSTNATTASYPNEGVNGQQTFKLWVTVINNTIARISGGALGFPVY